MMIKHFVHCLVMMFLGSSSLFYDYGLLLSPRHHILFISVICWKILSSGVWVPTCLPLSLWTRFDYLIADRWLSPSQSSLWRMCTPSNSTKCVVTATHSPTIISSCLDEINYLPYLILQGVNLFSIWWHLELVSHLIDDLFGSILLKIKRKWHSQETLAAINI